MELRFFKKLNGEKILQQKVKKLSTLESKWEDVPLVEEKKPLSLETIKIMIDVYMKYNKSALKSILISKSNFYMLENLLNDRSLGIRSPAGLFIVSVFGIPVEGVLFLPDDQYVTVSEEGEMKCNKIN